MWWKIWWPFDFRVALARILNHIMSEVENSKIPIIPLSRNNSHWTLKWRTSWRSRFFHVTVTKSSVHGFPDPLQVTEKGWTAVADVLNAMRVANIWIVCISMDSAVSATVCFTPMIQIVVEILTSWCHLLILTGFLYLPGGAPPWKLVDKPH